MTDYFATMFLRIIGTLLLVVIFGIVGDATIAVILFIGLIVLWGRRRG